MEKMEVNFHSSICIADRIYVDPLKMEKRGDAKIVFITHPHWDHLDLPSISNVMNKETFFVCTQDSAKKLLESKLEIAENKIRVVSPNEKFKILDVGVETFPAYNLDKNFHKKSECWVGYILEIDGVRYMICGDSDVTEELKSQKADVVFAPIGGTYTMTAQEAASLANIICPKVVVPVHYGEVVGDKNCLLAFREELSKQIECRVLL